jgi:hypothetical protein
MYTHLLLSSMLLNYTASLVRICLSLFLTTPVLCSSLLP